MIQLRILGPEDASEFVRLMNAEYGRDFDEDYFLWQYIESAYPSVSIGAFDEDELVGIFGLQKKELVSGEEVGQAIDLLIAPKWRGKGLFSRLGKMAISHFEGLQALCCLPNARGKTALENSLGWKTLGQINTWVYPYTPLEDKEHKPKRPLEKECLYSFLYTPQIREWRYDRHPKYNYETIKLTSEEFAITKMFIDETSKRRYKDIVDFSCGPENSEVFEVLISQIIEQSSQDETITIWALPYTPLAPIVARLGFQEENRTRYFCLKVLSPKYEYLTDFSRWHFVQADMEFF